jgi:hypothetical protein
MWAVHYAPLIAAGVVLIVGIAVVYLTRKDK